MGREEARRDAKKAWANRVRAPRLLACGQAIIPFRCKERLTASGNNAKGGFSRALGGSSLRDGLRGGDGGFVS
jgi:hypothetical protein